MIAVHAAATSPKLIKHGQSCFPQVTVLPLSNDLRQSANKKEQSITIKYFPAAKGCYSQYIICMVACPDQHSSTLTFEQYCSLLRQKIHLFEHYRISGVPSQKTTNDCYIQNNYVRHISRTKSTRGSKGILLAASRKTTSETKLARYQGKSTFYMCFPAPANESIKRNCMQITFCVHAI